MDLFENNQIPMIITSSLKTDRDKWINDNE